MSKKTSKKTKKTKARSKKSSIKKVTKKKSNPIQPNVLIDDDEYKNELKRVRKKLESFVEKDLNDFNEYTFDSEEEFYDHEVYIPYNNLNEEEKNILIKKFTGRAQAYLEKIGIEEFEIDSKDNMIIVPFNFENFQFLCNILVTPEWYFVKTSLLELDKSISKIEKELYFLLLKGNFELNAITYSVDPEKRSVWVEADIPTDAGYEHFRLRYLGIVYGIDYFINNVAEQLKAPLESTYKPDAFDKNIYI
ncbi:MAG: hypothetical protein ACTSRZ_17680 [Promethearchaeota archaeon]